MKPLRTLRSLLGIGLIWGVLWASLAMIIGIIIGIIDPSDIDPGEEPIVLAPLIGLAGFVCGGVFVALVSIAEKRQPMLELSPIRVAMWGVLVSAALALVTGKGMPEMLITVPLCAMSAMASVAIMRTWAAPQPVAR